MMSPQVPQAAQMAPAAPRAPMPAPMAPMAPAFRQQAPAAFAAAPESSASGLSGATGAIAAALVFIVAVLAVATRGPQAGARAQLSPETQKHLNRINPELHREVATLLLFLGGVLTLVFIRNEVRQGSGILQQVCVSMLASMLLGFGSFFLLAWAGVYAA